MPDINAISMAGALVKAAADKTRMASSVIHLYKSSFTPTATTTKAEFLAQECDYDGYAPLTITAWGDPVLAGQAWAIFAPTQTFRWTHDTDDIGNQVGGYFIVTAAGDLMDYSIFGPTIPMQGPGQAVIKTPIQIEAAG